MAANYSSLDRAATARLQSLPPPRKNWVIPASPCCAMTPRSTKAWATSPKRFWPVPPKSLPPPAKRPVRLSGDSRPNSNRRWTTISRTRALGTGNGEVDRSTLFHARSDDVVPLAVKLFALDLQFSQFLL